MEKRPGSGLRGVEAAVSFESQGFRDVYWCGLLNEPEVLTYRNGTPYCEGCEQKWASFAEFHTSHKFVCHVGKAADLGMCNSQDGE